MFWMMLAFSALCACRFAGGVLLHRRLREKTMRVCESGSLTLG